MLSFSTHCWSTRTQAGSFTCFAKPSNFGWSVRALIFFTPCARMLCIHQMRTGSLHDSSCPCLSSLPPKAFSSSPFRTTVIDLAQADWRWTRRLVQRSAQDLSIRLQDLDASLVSCPRVFLSCSLFLWSTIMRLVLVGLRFASCFLCATFSPGVLLPELRKGKARAKLPIPPATPLSNPRGFLLRRVWQLHPLWSLQCW